MKLTGMQIRKIEIYEGLKNEIKCFETERIMNDPTDIYKYKELYRLFYKLQDELKKGGTHMECEHCGEEIKWSRLKLELPCYASSKELCFCDYDCLYGWIEDYTQWEEEEGDIDEY